MRHRSRVAAGVVGASVLVLAGRAYAGELLVTAAVSLRAPLTEIARVYEKAHPAASVQLAFGASNVLASQIRAGAPVDVFAPADERIVDALAAEGLVAGDRVELARNRLVVVVREGLSSVPARADDLVDPALCRIAVPEYAVPVGRYAREWLAERGLLARLAPRLVATEHARATLAAVDHGHADAAIVYASDAALARSARVAFRVPEAEQPRIVYAAARMLRAPDPAEADRFLRFLSGAPARAALAAAGLVPPAPPAPDLAP